MTSILEHKNSNFYLRETFRKERRRAVRKYSLYKRSTRETNRPRDRAQLHATATVWNPLHGDICMGLWRNSWGDASFAGILTILIKSVEQWERLKAKYRSSLSLPKFFIFKFRSFLKNCTFRSTFMLFIIERINFCEWSFAFKLILLNIMLIHRTFDYCCNIIK